MAKTLKKAPAKKPVHKITLVDAVIMVDYLINNYSYNFDSVLSVAKELIEAYEYALEQRED